MTPRKLELDVIHDRLRLIKEVLEDLSSLGEVSLDRLKRERLTRRLIERMLTELVDLAVGINTHIAAALLERTASDYKDSFLLAAKAGAISEQLASVLAPSAGMRNVIVHEYRKVEMERIAVAVPPAIEQYGEYVSSIAAFLSMREA